MPQFNIYLMSSEREGLPITIYEAFYQKTSVVSTKAGGVPEAITHNVNGLLSEIKDYKDLAKNILILIKQPKLKDAFVEKSYSLILNKFTTKQLAKKYIVSL
jgi:glycosyltransferase involved in cell wall biosynthesis